MGEITLPLCKSANR